jgi:hypothetical protein
MATSPLYYGQGIDGKKYGFKAPATAYPDAILAALGLTKLADNATLPTDVNILPNNQVRGYFCRIYVGLQDGSTKTKFIAANKAGAANALKGLSIGASKVINVKFTG